MPAAGGVSQRLGFRARQTRGTSGHAIYEAVALALNQVDPGGLLVDVGCGTATLWTYVEPRFGRYVGIDAVRHPGFPARLDLHETDLDRLPIPLPDGVADVVAAVETIEHLENPWAFWRELARVARPGGWVVVTTPNQESLLSLMTLLVKRRFSAFGDASYPMHRTALLAIDLERMAAEAGLMDVRVIFTGSGRIPLTAAHYPQSLARRFPRALSDNILVLSRVPHG
jgi:SAM-dependent methyltransferase